MLLALYLVKIEDDLKRGIDHTGGEIEKLLPEEDYDLFTQEELGDNPRRELIHIMG